MFFHYCYFFSIFFSFQQGIIRNNSLLLLYYSHLQVYSVLKRGKSLDLKVLNCQSSTHKWAQKQNWNFLQTWKVVTFRFCEVVNCVSFMQVNFSWQKKLYCIISYCIKNIDKTNDFVRLIIWTTWKYLKK